MKKLSWKTLDAKIVRKTKITCKGAYARLGYIAMSNTNQTPITLERILDAENINRAIKQVVVNQGAPGVDGMSVHELEDFCRKNPYKISNAVRLGKYKPQPILRAYIPKDNGEQRPLGIPTVIDRVVQ